MKGADGESLSFHERWGAWLDAFGAALAEITNADDAQAFWEHNEDTFIRGQKAAEKSPAALEKFLEAGKLALQKRMPPMEGGDGELL